MVVVLQLMMKTINDHGDSYIKEYLTYLRLYNYVPIFTICSWL